MLLAGACFLFSLYVYLREDDGAGILKYIPSCSCRKLKDACKSLKNRKRKKEEQRRASEARRRSTLRSTEDNDGNGDEDDDLPDAFEIELLVHAAEDLHKNRWLRPTKFIIMMSYVQVSNLWCSGSI